MEKKITLLIADDHPLFLEGLVTVIMKSDKYDIAAKTDNGETAVRLARTHTPDIIVLDIQMPQMDGLRAAETILKEQPNAKIILLTMFNEENLAKRAMQKGVKGFVLKENAVSSILHAISAVADGGLFISPQVSPFTKREDLKKSAEKSEVLTFTEERVLKFIGEGMPTKEIAGVLNVSAKTIENHRGNICKKLGISGTSALLRYAMQNKAGTAKLTGKGD